MLGRIWGQTRCVFVRGTRYGDRHDLGPASLAAAHRYGDRHDVRYTDQERSTSNIQLSTFNWVTERAHAGPNMGTDTICIGAEPRCHSGPPLDSQPDLWHVTAKYGDRHSVWAPGDLTRTCPSTCRPGEAGLGSVALLQGETQQSRRL